MNPESLFVCPPVPVPGERFGLTAPGHWHVMGTDCWYRVNEFAFPNVQDVVEEIRVRGLNYRIVPKIEQFKDSPILRHVEKVVLLHPRALTDEAAAYQNERVWRVPCPRGIDHGPDYMEMCCGLYREDVDGATPVRDPLNSTDELVHQADERHWRRLGVRVRPTGPYVAASRPRALKLPSEFHQPYQLAVFMEIALSA